MVGGGVCVEVGVVGGGVCVCSGDRRTSRMVQSIWKVRTKFHLFLPTNQRSDMRARITTSSVHLA